MDDMNEYGEKLIDSDYRHINEDTITQTFADYEEEPREYMLSLVQTILRLNTNVTDIFNKPIDQKNEQMRLTIEAMKERQECEILNDEEFGLVNNVSRDMIVRSRHGSPTPDNMDELLAKVWKKHAFFLAHPKAIAAFGRECTRRGVPPVVLNMLGSPFMTWRGVPLVPCDKLFPCLHVSLFGASQQFLHFCVFQHLKLGGIYSTNFNFALHVKPPCLKNTTYSVSPAGGFIRLNHGLYFFLVDGFRWNLNIDPDFRSIYLANLAEDIRQHGHILGGKSAEKLIISGGLFR
jgi:hypothetical protein